MAVAETREENAQPEIELSPFAKAIFDQKYSWKDEEGNPTESWNDTAYRVVENVLGALNIEFGEPIYMDLLRYITERKFIPGGRYLYAAGRSMHQVQNCALYRAEDTREGWAELARKCMMSLQTGAGVGVDYSDLRPRGAPIARTGGEASGPVSLMKIVNEAGREIMQGGSRRSAIWAGLNWKHDDIDDFIRVKDWDQRIRDIKENDFTFPAPMELTNISVLLDDEFFEAYGDENHPLHERARNVYRTTVARMVKTAEPGLSIDIADNAGETLRNAPVAGDTNVLTDQGYKQVVDLIEEPVTVWTGDQWASDVVFKRTNSWARIVKVAMTGGRSLRCDPSHEFLVERWEGRGKDRRLASIQRIPANQLQKGDVLHVSPSAEFVDGFDEDAYSLGYMYGDGTFNQYGGGEVSFCAEDSKVCAATVANASGVSSVNWSDSRGYTRAYFKSGTYALDSTKEQVAQEMFAAGNDEIASFLAGLFDSDGNWLPDQRRIRLASKHKSFLRDVARLLEQLGIYAGISKAGTSTYGKTQGWQLVVMSDYVTQFAGTVPTQRLELDGVEHDSYRKSNIRVESVEPDGFGSVYCADVGVPEHSFMAEGVIVSNCTEVTSADDSDICNLGSINLANIDTLEEFVEVVNAATLFLLAGTEYSLLPHDEMYEVRQKNRRLGLGLMGVHEWLLKRGLDYAPNEELAQWMDIYQASGLLANDWADQYGLSHPVATRAIAPTGTIGIIAETTTGIEPIFCTAYKRRYLKDNSWHYQYVVDPTAKRLVEEGVDPNTIEDAYVLSKNVEKRVAMQAWLQQYVDHGISSTINLPYPMTEEKEVNKFTNMLFAYLRGLRGITVYPDGARGGQPLTKVPYEEAINQEGVVFEEETDRCVGGSCGI